MGIEPDEFHVTVVVPTYNEEDAIESCLDSLLQAENQYGSKEILIVDGLSQDQTPHIVQSYARRSENIKLLKNPQKTTPYAMNIGMDAANGNYISFLSGHSAVQPDYFNQIRVAFSEAPDAGVIGGRMVPDPRTFFEAGVAGALISQFGSSSSRFQPIKGYVETVNFGTYRNEVVEQVGKMDTTLPRTQDYEYNRRVKQYGFKIFQYPDLQVRYTPRSTPLSLCQQYFGNGYWKTRVFRKYGDYPIDPQLSGVIGLLAFLLFSPVILVLLPVYLFVMLISSIRAIRSDVIENLRLAHVPAIVLALILMHLSFLAGLLKGSISSP